MGRAHDQGQRPAEAAPLSGNMGALHRAVTGRETKRGTPQSGPRDSRGEPRKRGKSQHAAFPVGLLLSTPHGCGSTAVTCRAPRRRAVRARRRRHARRTAEPGGPRPCVQCTRRVPGRRPYGGPLSRTRGSTSCARAGCRASAPGSSSGVGLPCGQPLTRRLFCRARAGGARVLERLPRWRPCTRSARGSPCAGSTRPPGASAAEVSTRAGSCALGNTASATRASCLCCGGG